MIKHILIFFCLLSIPHISSSSEWNCELNGFKFKWQIEQDKAVIIKVGENRVIWQGSLMPAFWLKDKNGQKQYVKAEGIMLENDLVKLKFGTFATGELLLENKAGAVLFRKLTIHWIAEIPEIISMYWGSTPLNSEQLKSSPTLEFPFWPSWEADNYCIPAAKGAPQQSFFRKWDFGQANIALGSFGISLGTPYAAAYPRPLFACAMGNKFGFAVLGAGSVPDAPMVLKIQSTTGCIHYLYREDLWKAPAGINREWDEPLRISFAETAYDAYAAYFNTFGKTPAIKELHQRNVWNSWGDFRKGDLNLRGITDRALQLNADILVIDGGWETFNGSGELDEEKFPEYKKDLEYIKQNGLKTGYWQNVIWVTDPYKFGLTNADLLCGSDNEPVKTSWEMNPILPGAQFCLDPSSEKTRKFIRERTQRIMRELRPEMLKLDMGYAVPSPDLATARDPEMRGEKLVYTLIKLIADAAKEINPDVTIQYYSIHPLFKDVQNLVALDDMGDAGNDEQAGHGQWSVWSSLAASHGFAIMASSGYDWNADNEILLNTAIIGSPGSVLPRVLDNGLPVPLQKLNRRSAIALWHRKTVGWEMLWLNSQKGSVKAEPALYCCGRVELLNGKKKITSLALRETEEKFDTSILYHSSWKGRWAVISQGNEDIFQDKIAIVPFDSNATLSLYRTKKPLKVTIYTSKNAVGYNNWKWENGFLIIKIEEKDNLDLKGFIVE
jgi:hypothetical protein